MKKFFEHRELFRKHAFIFCALIFLALLCELFLANYRDLSIGDAPELTLEPEQINRLDSADLTDDGSITVYGAGAELEFTDIDIPVHSVTIYTSAPKGTVVIASCLLTDDASRYDYRLGNRLYFNPSGGHFFTRVQLSSNGNLHSLLLSVDRARDSFSVQRIVFNERRGFYFDKLRFLIILSVLFLVFVCRHMKLTLVIYDPSSRLHRSALYGCMGLCLVVLLWIFGALASFGAADPITYPLEQPVSEYGAYVQQFDAFQKHRFSLDLPADPQLEQLQNVYDFSERAMYNGPDDWKEPYWDRAYYEGQYYSYFGIGPILTVYYPYYLITGALPGDALVSLIYCAAMVFLLFGVLEELRRRFLPRVHLFYYVLGFITVFFAGLIPLVMVSTCFYYIAVTAAMTFLLLFLFLFLKAFSMKQGLFRRICAAVSGIAFVLIVLCRPNVALAAACTTAPLAVLYLLEKDTAWKYKLADLLAFLVPICLGAAFVMWYNAARFDSPFEFGTSYQLTVSDITYNTVKLAPHRLLCYLYYYLLQPLDTELFFPFVSMRSEGVTCFGNFVYHASSMGLLALPFFGFLAFAGHRYIDYSDRVKRFTYAGTLIGALLLSHLNFSLGGIFVRYLCDIALLLALPALLIALEYEQHLTESRFGRRVILYVFCFTIFIGAMLIFSNENMMLLNDAPEYYLRIMDLFRL